MLEQDILACRRCEDRFGYAPHPIVFGNEHAKIMQISQAPSQNVHKTLRPFDDASGRKLRNEWYDIDEQTFYDPDHFYITALAHCYPGKSANGGDRLPPKICAGMWLRREMEWVDNRIYVIIGARAAHYFFPNADYTELIFNDQVLNGRPTYVLPHPSPLNVGWFKAHPEFISQRIQAIRDAVHSAIGM